MATEVCVDCGRTKRASPMDTCDQPDWHQPLPTAQPTPAPVGGGLELVLAQGHRVQHLEEELRSVWRVLAAVVVDQGGELRVPLELLELEQQGGVVNSWRDEAHRELVLQVRP